MNTKAWHGPGKLESSCFHAFYILCGGGGGKCFVGTILDRFANLLFWELCLGAGILFPDPQLLARHPPSTGKSHTFRILRLQLESIYGLRH